MISDGGLLFETPCISLRLFCGQLETFLLHHMPMRCIRRRANVNNSYNINKNAIIITKTVLMQTHLLNDKYHYEQATACLLHYCQWCFHVFKVCALMFCNSNKSNNTTCKEKKNGVDEHAQCRKSVSSCHHFVAPSLDTSANCTKNIANMFN